MGFADAIKGAADKARGLARGHSAQVDQAVEKAGDAVDDRTGGKYAAHVDKAQEAVKKNLGE